MTSTTGTDVDDLRIALEDRLRRRLGQPVQIPSLTPLAGGACQENAQLQLVIAGGAPRTLVLRGDAASSLPGSLGRSEEFAVVQAAVAAGAPSPTPHWLFPDLLGQGRDAWLMDFATGEALGRRVVHQPRYANARQGLVDQVAAAMAALRRVTPAGHPHLPLSRPGASLKDPAADSLAFNRQMLDALPTSHPALELVMVWLEQNRPTPPDELCLVHGDLRTGNLLIDESGLVALLDYEFAHWGDPAEDAAWLCVRDWRFGRLDRAAGGFATRAQLHVAVERATGQCISPARLHWWEVQGNLAWAAGALYQGERFLSGDVLDIELLAIPWRAAEMTWEALRLICVGPDGREDWPRASGPALPPDVPSAGRPDEATALRGLALFLEGDLRHRVADKAVSFRTRIAAHLLSVIATWQTVGPEVERLELIAANHLLGAEAPPPDRVGPLRQALLAQRENLAKAIRSGRVSADRALPVLMGRLRAELAVRSPMFDPDAAVD